MSITKNEQAVILNSHLAFERTDMTTNHSSITRRALSSIKRVWNETEYAQRRLLDIRIATPIEPRSDRR
jgi:hypothetical protein